MDDLYILKNGITKEKLFRLRLIEGFHFAPIVAEGVLNLSKDFFQNSNTAAHDGQIIYIAVSEVEGPGKSIVDTMHKEIILTLDDPKDMEVYQKFGLAAYRQQVVLRITEEAREQQALLSIKDLVKLLKNSYSTIKRDIKTLREKGLYVPIRGLVKDIGPSSHKAKIVEMYVKRYTTTEIQRATRHSLGSIERYIRDFSRVSILTERKESVDNIRLVTGISERLVKEYQEIYRKYKDSEHKQKIEELVSNTTVHGSPMTFKKTKEVRA